MGDLFGNGGGGPVESNFTLGNHVKYEYSALLNQLDPTGTDITTWGNFDVYPEMNMRDILFDAMDLPGGGGNPFTGVAATNPSTYLDKVLDRYDALQDTIDAMTPRDWVEDSVTSATTLVDDNLLSTAQIDGLVNAFDQRTKTRHLQAVARITDSLNMSMAGMTSTVSDRLADLELDRQQEISDFELKLVYGDRQRRTEMVQFLTQNYLATLGLKIDASKANFIAAIDNAKINVSALQDQIDKDVEYTTSEQLWNVQTIKHGFEALQVGSGMPMIPRAPTKAERTMQQITSAISFGAEAGAAFGPGAGVLAGGGVLALNFLLNRAS